jgi:hypothetical protein
MRYSRKVPLLVSCLGKLPFGASRRVELIDNGVFRDTGATCPISQPFVQVAPQARTRPGGLERLRDYKARSCQGFTKLNISIGTTLLLRDPLGVACE